MVGPRPLKPSEYQSLLDLLNACFPADRTVGVPARWPHLFDPEAPRLRHCIVVADGGQVASHAGVEALTMIADGQPVPAASLTFVATAPGYREKGLMSKCLEACVALMREDGTALCWLIGDRNRYGNFGWENAGGHYFFNLTARSVRALPAPKMKVVRYQGEPRFFQAIQDIYRRRRLRFDRSDEKAALLLARAGKEIFVALKGQTPRGYLAFERLPANHRNALTCEHGGTPDAVAALLLDTFANQGVKKLTVTSPRGSDPARPVFFAAASNWQITTGYIKFPHGGHMIKIIDLYRTLMGFRRQMENRRRRAGARERGEITLVLRETGQRATMVIGDTIRVTRKKCAVELTLDERAMVRLLFAMHSPSESCLRPVPAVLETVFPLDFFVSPLEDT